MATGAVLTQRYPNLALVGYKFGIWLIHGMDLTLEYAHMIWLRCIYGDCAVCRSLDF